MRFFITVSDAEGDYYSEGFMAFEAWTFLLEECMRRGWRFTMDDVAA